MHRLFSPLIVPLIETLEPAVIVETGAGSGRLTRRLLDATGSARVHAVDPAPEIDPGLVTEEVERLEVHACRAIAALGRIGPVDLALLDGDPNWYSIHAELETLAKAARLAQRTPPVIVVHNVHWPFGRRDGYYDPAAIPVVHRRDFARTGLVPGRRDPSPDGLRLTPFCAVRDLEPRSGVLTAIDDFLSESELSWTLVDVPGFHGYAVLAEEQLLTERPALARTIERMQEPEFVRARARQAETVRLALEVELVALRDEDTLVALPAPFEGPVECSPDGEKAEPVAEETVEDVAQEVSVEADVLVELAEQRARREALEWQLARIEEELDGRDHRLTEITDERDTERRDRIEVQVRFEEAGEQLVAVQRQAAGLSDRIGELEEREQFLQRELMELADREKLIEGRLSHREDALQAADAERHVLQARLTELGGELQRSRSALAEISDRIEEVSATRWVRIGRRLRKIGRGVGIGRQWEDDPYLAATAAARRGLRAPTGEASNGALDSDDSAAPKTEVQRSV